MKADGKLIFHAATINEAAVIVAKVKDLHSTLIYALG